MSKLPAGVSVVVPAFNAKSTIEETVASVLKQTYTNFELIIVDDGSTDGTLELVAQLEEIDERIKLVEGKHLGPGAARNRGLDAAKNRWVLFLDADDLLAPHALETCLGVASETGANLVLFDTIPFPDPSASLDKGTLDRVNRYGRYYTRSIGAFVDRGAGALEILVANHSYLVSPCLYLFERAIVNVSGIRFDEILVMEDNLFTPHLMLAAELVAYTPEALHRRRVIPSSLTARSEPKHVLSLLVIAERLESWANKGTINESEATSIRKIVRTLRGVAHRDYVAAVLSQCPHILCRGIVLLLRVLSRKSVADR